MPFFRSIKFKRFNLGFFFITISALVIMFLNICALFPQWIAPYSPTQMLSNQVLQPPSGRHWFGSDYFGRDVFSVVVHGTRYSLLIGYASVLLAGIVGCLIGGIAGYVGGIVDSIVMRIIEILMTIPSILLALALVAALGPNLVNTIIAVSIAALPGYARVMRGQMVSLKNRGFVTASRSIGSSHFFIFFKHILPNAWSPILVMATVGLGTSILTGAGLSFLGLSALKENPDWGTFLSQGRGYLTVAWWIATFPGLAITLFVLSINVLGDRLRDYFDPKKSK
ncbi:ABC transporter permease [Bacillus sp. 03113]|uniref:ABC transporter permease n=1 Tax=Bacillus sp. 03113 TaxID=2578211 RepID=UPI001142CB42|nr:ABC transporter permease [Bacillus sp. 03113]